MTQQSDHLRPENEPLDDYIMEERLPEAPAQSGGVSEVAPAWLISFAVHTTIALIFSAAVFSQRKEVVELPPMRVTIIDAPSEKLKDEHTSQRAHLRNLSLADRGSFSIR